MQDSRTELMEACLTLRERLFNFIYRMTGNTELSGEILQRTYLSAVKAIDRFEGRSSLLTWMTAIARNEVYKSVGNRKRDIRRLETLRSEENLKPATTVSEAYEHAVYIEQIKNGCLFALLYCLPFNQRAAFILHILNEIPIDITGGILGKSPNAVRILVSRARAAIRRFLCDNCEHIAENPRCRCLNMLNFSISNNLVRKIEKSTAVSRAKVNLGRFRDEIDLMKTLPEMPLSPAIIEKAEFATIFSENVK